MGFKAETIRVKKGGTNRIDRSSETEELKICTKCLEYKQRESFNHISWCPSCIGVLNRKHADARGIVPKFIPKVTDTYKQCCRCKEMVSLEDYTDASRGRKGKAAYCRPCMSKYQLEFISLEERRTKTQKYRDNNREWWRSLHRINQFNRRQKIDTKSDGTVTPEFVKEVYGQKVCRYCKEYISRKLRTLEHILPLNRGGNHSSSNITMACLSCNTSKRDKTEEEFFKYLKEKK